MSEYEAILAMLQPMINEIGRTVNLWIILGSSITLLQIAYFIWLIVEVHTSRKHLSAIRRVLWETYLSKESFDKKILDKLDGIEFAIQERENIGIK